MTTVANCRTADPDAALEVNVERVVSPERAGLLYEIYLTAFSRLRTQAAGRHVLSSEEFLSEMFDPRIVKHSVWRSEREPIALATVTKELNAVTWISPEFFAAHHTEHAAREAIYYLGIALVVPGRGQFRLLERLVDELVKECVADKGVLAYDVCDFNNRTIQFGKRAEAILKRVAPVEVSVADTQTYYQAVFQ